MEEIASEDQAREPQDEVSIATVDAVRSNRLVHANLTNDTDSIIRILNQAISEGDRSLSRLVMVLAADMCLYMTVDKTKEQAIAEIDAILASHLRHGE